MPVFPLETGPGWGVGCVDAAEFDHAAVWHHAPNHDDIGRVWARFVGYGGRFLA
jgi:hypothetical protein